MIKKMKDPGFKYSPAVSRILYNKEDEQTEGHITQQLYKFGQIEQPHERSEVQSHRGDESHISSNNIIGKKSVEAKKFETFCLGLT